MIRRPYQIKILLFLGLSFSLSTISIGQHRSINLIEALNIAGSNYAGLKRDKLTIDQQNKLLEAGMPQQRTQLFFSGEEFGIEDLKGTHTLNIKQNFYLPKVASTRKSYYEQGVVLAKKQLTLTEKELKWQIERVFYQLLYAKKYQVLADENLILFDNFLSFATSQLEAGETGESIQLAARFRLGQAQLNKEHAIEKYQIAFNLFNLWIQSDTLYDARGDLSYETELSTDTSLDNNVHLQIIKAEQKLANIMVENEKAQLLPEIITGLKLQTESGNFPLFGYQIGVNIPLFRKAYRGRIEAAELGVKIQDANIALKEQALQQKISSLRYSINHQQHILKYLKENMTPIVNDHNNINMQAYKEGEISYLEYLDSLEQIQKVKQQYLDALYKLHILKIELNFWIDN